MAFSQVFSSFNLPNVVLLIKVLSNFELVYTLSVSE